VQQGRDDWCYVDADGSVELRPVTLGKTNDKFVEIHEGLEEGDRVVLNPMSLVEEGQDNQSDIGPESGADGDAHQSDESTSDKPDADKRDGE